MLTSDLEGFGLVIIESMSYGVVPVVYGSYEAVFDIIRNDVSGFITPVPYDKEITTEKVRFLIEHSAEMPELWIRSEEEYRLYSELKRAVNDTTINDVDNNLGFNFGNFTIVFEDGNILISKGKQIFAKYAISDFSRRPNAVFRQIQNEFLRFDKM